MTAAKAFLKKYLGVLVFEVLVFVVLVFEVLVFVILVFVILVFVILVFVFLVFVILVFEVLDLRSCFRGLRFRHTPGNQGKVREMKTNQNSRGKVRKFERKQ